MALATLSVDLVAKLAKFEDDMGKAARASEKASQRITQSLAGIGTGIAGLASAISLAGVAGFTKQLIDGVDALNDLKDASGASIENISALEDIAARTGTSFDAVGTALTKFNKLLNDASPGSEAEESLKALGLNAKELREIDPAEAILKYAKAINTFSDDGKKARLVGDQLGRSYSELAPFLKDVAEAGQLNGTVTTAQAEAAEKFNKQIFELQKNTTDLGRSLVTDLVTGLNAAADAYRQNQSIFQAINAVFNGTDQNRNDRALVDQTDELLTLENEVLKLRASGTALDAAAARKKEERVKALKDEINTTLAYRKVLGDVPKAATKPSVVAPKLTGPKGQDPDADFKKYIDNLQKQIEKTQELTLVQQLGADVAAKRVTLTPEQITEAAIRAETADALIAQAKAQEVLKKASEEATKQNAAYFDGLIKSEEALRAQNQTLADQVAEIGLSKDALNALTLARLDSTIVQQAETVELLRANEGTEAEIKLAERSLELLKERRALTATGQLATAAAASKEDAARASADYAKTLEGDLKGAFSAAFRDSKDPLGAFGDALANVIYTRASSALADALIQSAFSSSTGTALASFLGFGSFEGGGYTGAGARAGGMDGKGGFMAMLHPNETVIDHTKGQSAGGSVTVIQNFTVGDVATVSMVKQAVAGSERRIAGALGRSKQYGGALA